MSFSRPAAVFVLAIMGLGAKASVQPIVVEFEAPQAAPTSLQSLTVQFLPVGIRSGWRFAGEETWHGSNQPVMGLEKGYRGIEYKPVEGYLEPDREFIDTAVKKVVLARTYVKNDAAGTGELEVTLHPGNLTDPALPVAQRVQWRLVGTSAWHDSGTRVRNLVPWHYLVEFKPVKGRVTPGLVQLEVWNNKRSCSASYLPTPVPVGVQPTPLSFQQIDMAKLPYAYVGQVWSDAGLASGFVVDDFVVATAAHVVFSDTTLSYVAGVQWLFQRDAGTYEPIPLDARGYLVLDGYTSQRQKEKTPGRATPDSQNLDVAALYFYGFAGRGGHSGYLASDDSPNGFISDANRKKLLIGYPIEGVSAANQGMMHATAAIKARFTEAPGNAVDGRPYRVYTTTDLGGTAECSGGPLCVSDGDRYYPLAIYLGGSGKSNFRTIDSDVVDLFYQAEAAGAVPPISTPSDPETSPGAVQVNSPFVGISPGLASLIVDLEPKEAIAAGAGWSLSSGGASFSSGHEVDDLTIDNPEYLVYMMAAKGFLEPDTYPAELAANQMTRVTVTYHGIVKPPASVNVAAGGSAVFSVEASYGASEIPPTYQWQKKTPTGTAYAAISGATAASYAVSNASSGQSGTRYCVVVTWSNGTQTSAAAVLTVTVPLKSQTIVFPAIKDPLSLSGDTIKKTLALKATASSGLAIVYTSSGPVKISNGIATFTGETGKVGIRASQPGNAAYSAAPSEFQTFTVLP